MRLFIGLPLSEDLRRRLELTWNGVRDVPDGCRSIDPQNWHVTVAFLGNTPDENLDALKVLFDKAVKNPPKGAFFLHEFRTFPPKHPSYIVAHAVPEYHAEWKKFIDNLREMLSLVAPQIDRKPWVPHISIARAKKRTALPSWSEPIEPILWRPERMAIVKSQLTQNGTQYNDLYDTPINL